MNDEVNKCNLSKQEKLSLEWKNEIPIELEDIELSVNIRRAKGKLKAIKWLKRKLTKLTGSSVCHFGVYTRKLGETKISVMYVRAIKEGL